MQLSLGRQRGLVGVAIGALVLLVIAKSLPNVVAPHPADTSLLTVHLLMEMFAVTIAVLIVTVTWHTFDPAANPDGNALIAGFVIVAVCDLTHALTYEGMPDFFGTTSTERAIFFWLMGRTFEVFTLGLIVVGGLRRFSRGQSVALGAAVGLAVVWAGSRHIDWFPQTFVEFTGVTPFKSHYEEVLTALDIGVAAALWSKGRRQSESRYRIMAVSALVIGLGELTFTSYVQPSDFLNIFGHVYKLVAYALLYWATFIASIRAPFDAQLDSERRAQESERRVRTLSDNLPGSMVYQVARDAGERMQFLHVSDGCRQLYGLSADEMLREANVLYERIHPEDRMQLRVAAESSARLLTVVDMPIRIRHLDGRERWIRVVSAPRRLDDGRTCWDGIHSDITEQRAAAARERESEALLGAVIESANDAVIGVDARGRITLFNPAAARIFRYPAQTMIGGDVGVLLPADVRPSVSGAGTGSLNLAEHLGASRVRGLRSDQQRLELEMSVSQVQVNGQQYFTAILRDITDRVRTERALVQYQVELTELTQALLAQEKATASRLAQALHDELGQTLAAIRIDFVGEVPLASGEERARHERVDRLIDQAVREVRQVLAELRPTILDESGLYEALKNELAGPRMSMEGVEVNLAAPPELRAQRWDPGVEYAAFMVTREAIANAVRHARATVVRVGLTGSASALRVEVSDNGAGFEPAAQTARPGHLGMVGMRERSIAIGARFEVVSSPGRGTSVVLAWQERER